MIKHLIIFVSFFVLLCCSSEDDDAASGTIIAKWTTVSRERFDCPNTVDNNTLTCVDGTGFCGTWEFKNDNTYSVSYTNGTNYTGEYELGNANFISLCTNGSCQTLTYSLNGATLVVTESDQGAGVCLNKYTFSRQ
jgi:hypothetical protein